MKIIENTTEFRIEEPTVAAIGKFDGFHRGHQKLLSCLKEQKQRGLATVVFTFVPSPAAFFSKQPIPELTTTEEKRRIFEQAGVDYLIEYPFYKKTADMEPECFVREVLVDSLHARCIVAGEDLSFGRRGAGDAGLLREMSAQYGYEVHVIEKVQYKGREVSSTYVREAIKEGRMELAAQLLGTPYQVGGTIIHGRQLGRTIGMPTVNLIPPPEKLLPPKGVYYSYVRLAQEDAGRSYQSITNIGTKPTVDTEPVMGVETYIYDFEGDVYGKELEVYLLHYKRPEMHFAGIEELKEQMTADMQAGRAFHKI